MVDSLETLKAQIGQTIRDLRRARGIPQAEACEKAVLSVESWSGIERGIGNPTLGTLLSMADALGVSVGELLPPAPEMDGLSPPLAELVSLLRGVEERTQQAMLDVVKDLLRRPPSPNQ